MAAGCRLTPPCPTASRTGSTRCAPSCGAWCAPARMPSSAPPPAAPARGAGTVPRDPVLDRDEMRALVDEAHALGRKVMCHALGGPGLRLAIEAGVDSIEHGSYLAEEPELFAMMAERGFVFTPTLLVYVYHRESPAPHVRDAPASSTRGTSRASGWPSPPGSGSPPAPTPVATGIPSTPASLSASWRRASRPCRRSRLPPGGRPSASAGSVSWAPSRPASSPISPPSTAIPCATSRACEQRRAHQARVQGRADLRGPPGRPRGRRRGLSGDSTAGGATVSDDRDQPCQWRRRRCHPALIGAARRPCPVGEHREPPVRWTAVLR